MSEQELILQVQLLQKQNEELKVINRKLFGQIVELAEQVEEFKFQSYIAQAINLANRRN